MSIQSSQKNLDLMMETTNREPIAVILVKVKTDIAEILNNRL